MFDDVREKKSDQEQRLGKKLIEEKIIADRGKNIIKGSGNDISSIHYPWSLEIIVINKKNYWNHLQDDKHKEKRLLL